MYLSPYYRVSPSIYFVSAKSEASPFFLSHVISSFLVDFVDSFRHNYFVQSYNLSNPVRFIFLVIFF